MINQTGYTVHLSYPQRVAIKSNRNVLIFKGLMGKKMLALRLRSSPTWFASTLIFFSPPIFSSARRKYDHLIRTIQNRQTSKDKRNKPGIQARSSLRKRKEYQHIRFSKRWLPSFPTGSNCLFSSLAGSLFPGLRLICRKTIFDEADGVEVWLLFRVPITSSVREKVFSPKFDLTPASKQPSTVVHSISQFGRHCCPGISNPYQRMVIQADLAPGPSCPRYFPPYKHVHRTKFLNSIEGYRVGQYQLAQQQNAPQRGLSSP